MPFDFKSFTFKPTRVLASVLPFVVMLPLMAWAVWKKSELNNSGIQNNNEHAMFDFDQHPYMNMGRMMRLENYQKVTPRHRMPGFPFLVSLVYSDADAYPIDPTGVDPRGASEGYFSRSKVLTIGMGFASLIGLFVLCRCFLPIWESHLVTWAYGWLVAAIRLPYVQPEVTFYVLFLLSLVLLWRWMLRPSWVLSLAAAVTMAAVFILKSSVVPLIMLFLACAGLLALMKWRALPRIVALAALVPVAFGVLLFPYFKNTAKLYGSPLWDVHSRHYLWMDTDEEKRFWRSAGISDPGFVPPEGHELPTARTYWRDHTLAEMGHRLKKGWYSIHAGMKSRYGGAHSLMKKFLLPALLVLAVLGRRQVWRSLREHPAAWLMVLGFFSGFAILYCWYQAIGLGPRLALALWLPMLFFGVLAAHRLTADLNVSFRGRKIPVRPVFNAAMLFLIALHTVTLIGGDYWTVEGGR